MEWIKQLNQAIEMIEENLDAEIDYGKLANTAGCSIYHFQRMFSYIADVPLHEYIRKRKMTKAAFDIQHTDDRILDIALRYGYDSPTAFNRAFQNIHGTTPSEARKKGIELKAYPKISFALTIKGAIEMNYKIVEKESFRIVGVKRSFNMKGEEGFTQVPKFWQEMFASGIMPKLIPLIDGEPEGVLGVSTGIDNFDYWICVPTSKEAPQGCEECIVPANTYAVFECIGSMASDAMNVLERRIMTEWFPTSGYELAKGMDMEVYPQGDQMSDSYKTYVWIPVKKK